MSEPSWPPPLEWPVRPLTDGVVVLDQLRASDAPRVVLGCTDPESQRWLPLPSPYGDPEARAFISSRDDAAVRGEELTFAVRGGDDGLLAGVMSLSQRGRRGEAEIGYWTAPDRRGRGWTARAVRLVAEYAVVTLSLRRVELLVAIDNTHSRRVAEAVGAAYEGIRRRGLPSADAQDAAIYSLIRPDFEAEQA